MTAFRRARALAAFMALAATAMVVVGCGDDDKGGGDADAKTGGKAPKVAFISWAYTDYTQAEEKGMKEAAEKLGGSVKVFNAAFDPQKINKDCQDAITSARYNAFVIAPIDRASAIPCVRAAKAAGIPVATIEKTLGTDPSKEWDVEPQVDGVVAVNANKLQTQVDAQAEMLKTVCADKDPCEVIAEISSPSDPLTTGTVKLIKDAVPGIKIVATMETLYDPATVAKKMPDLLTKHPGADVYLAAADSSARAAIPAIKAAGLTGKIVLIGNGGDRQSVKEITDGVLFGSVANYPQQAGARLVESLAQALNGEEVTNCCTDGLALDEPVVLTKETIGDFTAEYGAE
ncbi:MAG TPA: sugar ABC transporter substrate-binding protein [Baekduia sp.]|nr:sugar ABC transporter substrate-binding protein [Baekduia sp.]